MTAIAAASLPMITDMFDAQHIANSAWAEACRSIFNSPCRNALSAAAIPKLSDFEVQGIVVIAWSNAVCAYQDRTLSSAIAASALRNIRHFYA